MNVILLETFIVVYAVAFDKDLSEFIEDNEPCLISVILIFVISISVLVGSIQSKESNIYRMLSFIIFILSSNYLLTYASIMSSNEEIWLNNLGTCSLFISFCTLIMVCFAKRIKKLNFMIRNIYILSIVMECFVIIYIVIGGMPHIWLCIFVIVICVFLLLYDITKLLIEINYID